MRFLEIVAGAGLLAVLTGCMVPQPRGGGKLERLVEPDSQRVYWLYLPKSYDVADDASDARRWPLVITFHGLKPFDSAQAQAREWEQEADRYGLLVVAPELKAPDVLRFPVRTITPIVKSDEAATLAILDHVVATHRVDEAHVLATGWSSGGYLAHYMLNRHPERFTCLAVRQADFAASILDAAGAARSRYHPVLVLNGQRDFPVVRQETDEAVVWYEAHRYPNFAWVEVKDLGHERTPDLAAAFFAHFAGLTPNPAPAVLTRRHASAGNPRGIAWLAGGAMEEVTPPTLAAAEEIIPPAVPTRSRVTLLQAQTNEENGALVAQAPPPEPEPAPAPVEQPAPPPPPKPRPAPPRSPIAIRVSGAIGMEPLTVTFSADCPADWQRTAKFLWSLDGEAIGSGINGQKTIPDAGEHTLGLLVTSADGQEHRAYKLIRVLPHAAATQPTGRTAHR